MRDKWPSRHLHSPELRSQPIAAADPHYVSATRALEAAVRVMQHPHVTRDMQVMAGYITRSIVANGVYDELLAQGMEDILGLRQEGGL